MKMVTAILGAIFGLLLLGACDDNGGGAPAATNTITEAVAAYVGSTGLDGPGLDGETFELTDPGDCDAVQDIDAAVGKICIDFKDSEIGDMTAIVEVGMFATEAVWDLTLELQDNTWVVTNSEYIGL